MALKCIPSIEALVLEYTDNSKKIYFAIKQEERGPLDWVSIMCNL